MNQVRREESKYWDNSKLATCFVACMSNLWIGLQKEVIFDLFYPDVCDTFDSNVNNDCIMTELLQLNLLEGRLDTKVMSECCKCLEKTVKKFLITKDLGEFFPTL